MLHDKFVCPSIGIWLAAGVLILSTSGCARSTVWLGTGGNPDPGMATTVVAGHGSNPGEAGEPDDFQNGDFGRPVAGPVATVSAKTPPTPMDAAGSGGAKHEATGAGSGAAISGTEPQLPKPLIPCPTLVTGSTQILGAEVELWVGTKSSAPTAPVLIYWHDMDITAHEDATLFNADALSDVIAQGGIVAAPNTTTGKGTNMGSSAWYTGDFEVADEVVACAAQQLNIDPRRIFVVGSSEGGMMAEAMLFERSGYVASVVLNSGAQFGNMHQLQNPLHVPPLMTLHGQAGVDVLTIDVAAASEQLGDELTALHGFVVECDHGGDHAMALNDLRADSWQFLNDHPFVLPQEPYAAGLPESFPTYCKIR